MLKSFTCLISISFLNLLWKYKLYYNFNKKHDELKLHPPQFEVSFHNLLLAKDPEDEFSFSLWKPNSVQRGKTPNASTCWVRWNKWSVLKGGSRRKSFRVKVGKETGVATSRRREMTYIQAASSQFNMLQESSQTVNQNSTGPEDINQCW